MVVRFGAGLRLGDESSGEALNCPSSCLLSESKQPGADIVTVFLLFFSISSGLSALFMARGFGASVSGTVPGGEDTYGLVSGIESSVDVNNLTAGEWPEPMCM
ncbi:hypothetical protein RRF57_008706 [Xylaria bambusicola]|uniref:Uncharacterized protein n=1 Tax=Xylaria bambusicola TaxID=326684 RepID=A0AAN7Z8I6_9PEZI